MTFSAILSSLLGGLCIFFSCTNSLADKLTIKQYVITIFLTLACVTFLPVSLGQLRTYFVLTGILILVYCFSYNKWLNLSCALFSYLFSVTVNHLYLWTAQYLLNSPVQQIISNPFFSVIFSFIYCISCFIYTWLLGLFLRITLSINGIFTDSRLCRSLFISLSFLSFLFIFNFSYGEDMGYSYGVIAFNGCLFLLLFFSNALLFNSLYQNMKEKQNAETRLIHYEQLQQHLKKTETLYSKIRSDRHDYMNILTTFSSYIDDGNLVALADYYHQKIDPIKQKFYHSEEELGKLSQMKILEVKSILSHKIIIALENYLKVLVEIKDSITYLSASTLDISRILGIFLDNAIEAAIETNDKKLQICFIKNDSSLVIIIKNSTLPLSDSISELMKCGISSRGPNRGIGLHNVSLILEDYRNIIWDSHCEDGFFIQKLTLLDLGKD